MLCQIKLDVKSTVAHTQSQNIHVEHLNKLLKTLSIPEYCASVLNFRFLPACDDDDLFLEVELNGTLVEQKQFCLGRAEEYKAADIS